MDGIQKRHYYHEIICGRKQVLRNFRNMKNIIKSKRVSISVNRTGTNTHNFQTCLIADLHHAITHMMRRSRSLVMWSVGSTLYELVDTKAGEGCSSWNDSSILYQHLTVV
jgi:hypothetical protein